MLDKKQKYLQIALNSALDEAEKIISQIPLDKKIIIEAGTPLIKAYGIRAIKKLNFWWSQRVLGYDLLDLEPSESRTESEIDLNRLLIKFLEKKVKTDFNQKVKKTKTSFLPYIVADLKCMDRGAREVEIAKQGGAGGAIALGQAPKETLDTFIENCEKYNLDAMIDMMNVEFPLNVLRQLKKLPQVVILHRGVDEETLDRESEIPYHEIQRIKENYDIMVAVAGADTFQEIQRAIFNDADIVVVWKSFYQSAAETAKIAEEFLKEIK